MITRHAPKLALAVLLAAACLYTYRAESVADYSYPAAGIDEITIKTTNGKVNVRADADTVVRAKVTRYAWGRDKADAEKALENVTFTGTVEGGRLMLRAEIPAGQRPYGCNFDVGAPETTGLSLEATNGAVSVEGLTGAVAVSTTNGEVTLTGNTGSAEATTTNGAVKVLVHSGAVACHTTNGAVECDLAALGATDDALLETTNGAVTLLLPADVSCIIDATTTNGLITIIGFTPSYEIQTREHVRCTIGSGASNVTITTTNGEVTIRRRS